ncbi:MAG: hypothetical protein LBK76_08700 [Verrucomicrobiales bacterium]|jgi:hypothetical protein|nr:hypothetical protein [Verrucomicrobiales bacterium]
MKIALQTAAQKELRGVCLELEEFSPLAVVRLCWKASKWQNDIEDYATKHLPVSERQLSRIDNHEQSLRPDAEEAIYEIYSGLGLPLAILKFWAGRWRKQDLYKRRLLGNLPTLEEYYGHSVNDPLPQRRPLTVAALTVRMLLAPAPRHPFFPSCEGKTQNKITNQ